MNGVFIVCLVATVRRGLVDLPRCFGAQQVSGGLSGFSAAGP